LTGIYLSLFAAEDLARLLNRSQMRDRPGSARIRDVLFLDEFYATKSLDSASHLSRTLFYITAAGPLSSACAMQAYAALSILLASAIETARIINLLRIQWPRETHWTRQEFQPRCVALACT